jgi:hypothetical protein
VREDSNNRNTNSLEQRSPKYLNNLQVPQVNKIIKKKKKIGIKQITGRSQAGDNMITEKSDDPDVREQQQINISKIKNK